MMRHRLNKKGEFPAIPLFFIIGLILFHNGYAQEIKENKEEKSVKTAMLKSAVIPGLGQWYNGKKIKAVIVFGGEMSLIGGAVYQNQRAMNSDTAEEKEFYQYDRNKFIWWLAAVHLLNILDAYVDASLWDFDTGPDLSYDAGNCNCRMIGVKIHL